MIWKKGEIKMFTTGPYSKPEKKVGFGQTGACFIENTENPETLTQEERIFSNDVRNSVDTLSYDKWQLKAIEKNIQFKYTSFNRRWLVKQIALAYELDHSFHLRLPKEVRHIVRKYGLPREQMKYLYQDLISAKLRENTDALTVVGQILKYAIKHGNSLNILDLIQSYESINDEAVRCEIMWAIAYQSHNQKDLPLDQNILLKLNTIAMNSTSQQSKAFLIEQLRRCGEIHHSSSSMTAIKPINTNPLSSKSRPKLEITRQRQTSKTTYIHKQREEANIEVLDVAQRLRHKNKQILINSEKVPTHAGGDGSDQSWWGGTYYNVCILYNLAVCNKPLKNKDKNVYLPNIFLNMHNKWFAYGTPGIFFIDRMICKTFYIISKKQSLPSTAIDKLVESLDLTYIKEAIFKSTQCNTIVWKMIANSICLEKYKKEPKELVANIADKLSKCATWADGIIKIDSNDAIKIIDDELNAMRLDAISAIYYSVVRDRTVLSNKNIAILEKYLSDIPNIRKMVINVLGALGVNDKVNYKKLFKACIGQIDKHMEAQDQDIDKAINYIMLQVQNKARCSELFTKEVVLRVIFWLNKGRLNYDNQFECLHIVNCCFQNSSSEDLLIYLENLMFFIQNTTNGELRREALKTALLATKETKSLPNPTILALVERIKTFDCDSSRIAVMVLFEVDNIHSIDFNMLSFKLQDDVAIVEENDEIIFAPCSKGNKSYPSIAALSAKILVNSIITNPNIKLTADTLSNLLSAIGTSKDKQTRVHSAKALFLGASNQQLEDIANDDALFEVQPYLQDPIADIAVYTTIFYVESLSQYSLSSQTLLSKLHIDWFSRVYVFEEMRLGEHDFSQRINTKFLEIVCHEAKKGQNFRLEIFKIFDHILFSTNTNQAECLEALKIIAFNGAVIPNKTIEVLENLLGTLEYHDNVFKVLNKIVRNGQLVGEKSLAVFINNLYSSEDQQVRDDAFECLTLADQNAVCLPDRILEVLELERAGKEIAYHTPNQSYAFAVLDNATSKGQKLPLSLFDILSKEGNFNYKALNILENVTINKQCIPDKVLEKLADRFDSEAPNGKMLTICFYVVQNNQELPRRLIEKLHNTLENNSEVADNILFIFACKGQKGELLDSSVVSKILEWCLLYRQEAKGDKRKSFNINTSFGLGLSTMTQIFLAAICSMLQNSNNECDSFRNQAEQVFTKYLQETNVSFLRLCVEGLSLLYDNNGLSQAAIDILISFARGSQGRAKNYVLDLLKKMDCLDNTQQSVLKFIQSHELTYEEYLDKCMEFSKQHELAKNDFKKINQIIKTMPDLHTKAFKLLSICSNKPDIPVGLINNAAIIGESSTSVDVKQLSKQFLADMASCRVAMELPVMLSADKIGQPVEKGKVISAILARNFSMELLYAYKNLFLRLSVNDLQKTRSLLSQELLNKEYPENICLQMLECMLITTKRIKQQSEHYPRIFQKYLDSPNERIRSVCFSGLKWLQSQGYTLQKFKRFCDDLRIRIENHAQCSIDKNDLDLLNTIVSLKYISFPAGVVQSNWTKKLIASDWAKIFNLSSAEKFMLYQRWSEVESQFGKQLEKSNRLLRELHHVDNLSFEELSEIIIFLPKVGIKKFCKISNTSSSVYRSLRQVWLKSMLEAKLSKTINEQYINEKMIPHIALTLPIGLAERLIDSIESIDNPTSFESIVTFICRHHISKHQIKKHKTFGSLQKSLEIQLLQTYFRRLEQSRLINIFTALQQQGWEFEQLLNLIRQGLPNNYTASREVDLLHVLKILSQHEVLYHQHEQVLRIIEIKPQKDWIDLVNRMAYEHGFPAKGSFKTLKSLVDELESDNKNSKLVKELIGKGLLETLQQINSSDLKANISPKPIPQWSHVEIKSWAAKVNSQANYFSTAKNIPEFIAVAKRAVFLNKQFDLTNTQILSCLLALHNKSDRGRLLQVITGAGKTIITSILAVFQALQGDRVDIVTSSPVRAEEDAEGQASFYKMFDLTVADNLDRTVYMKGVKSCYRQNIVYGEAAQFQFDTLRDEYSVLGTMANRYEDKQRNVAILDEVDSMLIDDSSKIAKLSSTVAGMDQLQPIYYFLWQRLCESEKRVIEINGKMYFLYGKIEYNGDRIVLRYQDKEGLKEISDLREYFRKTTDISHIAEPIQIELNAFIVKKMESYLEEFIKKEVDIPSNFKEFLNKQVPRWIQSAILALSEFKENVHYVVQQGLIKPVAFNSNGVVQSSTNWSDGLHQFLQLKHNLKITSESFTTNFLSNIAYFKRYGAELFGLTGTLGSTKSQETLTEIYKVDLIQVPSIYQKRYKALPTFVADNQEQWTSEICFEAMHEVKKGRGVLIICKSIEDAANIGNLLRKKHLLPAVKAYTMNNDNQEKAVGQIGPGEIIVATNLAGRGTDIRTNAIESFGGMHVIVTYMPDNKRVEEQAFGRTSRQGNLGTGRKILNGQDLFINAGVDLDILDSARDDLEAKQLDSFCSQELNLIKIKDKLFQSFCKLTKEIREKLRAKGHCRTYCDVKGKCYDLKDTVKRLLTDVEPSFYESTIIAAMEEQWAMFLRRVDDNSVDIQDIDKEYASFEKNINDSYQDDKLIKNPYHRISIANDLLFNASFSNTDIPKNEAEQHYNAAIKTDKKHSAGAFIGKAWLALVRCKVSDSQNYKPYKYCYKREAVDNFKIALELLSNEMASLNAIQALLREHGVPINSDIVEQFSKKATILGSYLNSIGAAIHTIKESQRLVTVTRLSNYQASIESQQSTMYYDLERDIHGKVELKFRDDEQYCVQFNDLIVREGSAREGTVDQAIATIEAAFNDTSALGDDENKNYDEICVLLQDLDLSSIQSILSPNIEVKDINKTLALEELKGKKSFATKIISERISGFELKVNLEIVSIGGIKICKNNVSISEAIREVNACHIDSQIKLVFLNANEEVEGTLGVEFLKSSQADVEKKLEQLTFANLDLELSGDKEKLLTLVGNIETKEIKVDSIQIFEVNQGNLTQKNLDTKGTIKTLEESKEAVTIKLSGLNQESAKSIIPDCEDLSINVTFNNIQKSWDNLSEGQANVYFSQLTLSTAKSLISRLRKNQTTLAVCFKELTGDQAKAVIKKADLTQEAMGISQVKPLAKLFEYTDAPTVELAEFSARGIEYILELNERKFVPWRSICAVGMLSAVQMTAGTVLVVTGFGATVGTGLITEGAADLITLYRAYSTRSFSWENYCKQKAISLVISAACMGLQALKDARKGVQTVTSSVTEEVLEQAGTTVINNGKEIGKALVQSSKELKVLAFQQTGVTIAETGTREALNQAVDTISHFCFDQYKSNISSLIHNRISSSFHDSFLKTLVARMYVVDEMRQSQTYRNRIDSIITETLNPQNTFWQKQWQSIAMPLIRGVFSAPELVGSSFSMITRISGVLNGMNEINYVVEVVLKRLTEALCTISNERISINRLLQEHCSLNMDSAIAIKAILGKQKVIDQHGTINIVLLQKADFEEYDLHKMAVVQFLNQFDQNSKQANVDSTIALLSRVITEHIIRVAESQLIAPISSYVVAKTVNNFSGMVQDKLIRNQLMKEEQAIKEELYTLERKEDKKDEEFNRIKELKGDLNSITETQRKERLTYVTQIERTAKKYTTAYSQCEMVYHAKQKQGIGTTRTTTEPNKQVTEYAEDVAKNKPANLFDMMKMAAENNINIKIVDEGYHKTQEDIEKNITVVAFFKGEGGNLGHWALMGENGQVVESDNVNQGDDCGYEIFGKLTGKTVKELREETSKAICGNQEGSFNAIEAQNWLVEHYPTEAVDLLFQGGKRALTDAIRSRYSKEVQEFMKKNNITHVDLETAVQLSELVYGDSATGKDLPPKDSGLEKVAEDCLLEDSKFKMSAYKDPATKKIYFVIRGTEGAKQWLFSLTELGVKGKVYWADNPQLKDYIGRVRNENSDCSVVFTGHSYGGSAAHFLGSHTGSPSIGFDDPPVNKASVKKGSFKQGAYFDKQKDWNHISHNHLSIYNAPNLVNSRGMMSFTWKSSFVYGISFCVPLREDFKFRIIIIVNGRGSEDIMYTDKDGNVVSGNNTDLHRIEYISKSLIAYNEVLAKREPTIEERPWATQRSDISPEFDEYGRPFYLVESQQHSERLIEAELEPFKSLIAYDKKLAESKTIEQILWDTQRSDIVPEFDESKLSHGSRIGATERKGVVLQQF